MHRLCGEPHLAGRCNIEGAGCAGSTCIVGPAIIGSPGTTSTPVAVCIADWVIPPSKVWTSLLVETKAVVEQTLAAFWTYFELVGAQMGLGPAEAQLQRQLPGQGDRMCGSIANRQSSS